MVDIPDPQPGLVIRFAYLWRDDRVRGREKGAKDRPSAVVMAFVEADGQKRVAVAPITHSKPDARDAAVKVPPETARRLGLDDVPQWIVTREVNLFTWPGADVRAVPGKLSATIAYGFLPYALTNQVLAAVRQHVRQKSAKTVERDEAKPARDGARKSRPHASNKDKK